MLFDVHAPRCPPLDVMVFGPGLWPLACPSEACPSDPCRRHRHGNTGFGVVLLSLLPCTSRVRLHFLRCLNTSAYLITSWGTSERYSGTFPAKRDPEQPQAHPRAEDPQCKAITGHSSPTDRPEDPNDTRRPPPSPLFSTPYDHNQGKPMVVRHGNVYLPPQSRTWMRDGLCRGVYYIVVFSIGNTRITGPPHIYSIYEAPPTTFVATRRSAFVEINKMFISPLTSSDI